MRQERRPQAEPLLSRGAIRVDALQAVEVLWTPQEEGDTLSEDELLRDYPQLNVL